MARSTDCASTIRAEEMKSMFCSECGAQINDKAVVCPKCGVSVSKSEVKNHMVGAILQLIICMPAGIIPLIYACKVNSKLAQGDIAGAQVASKKARFWINLGTVIVGLIFVIALIAGAASSESEQQQKSEEAQQFWK